MKFIGGPTTSTGHSWLASVVIFWFCTVAIPTWAQQVPLSSPGVTKAERVAQQGHRWYDGEQHMTAWLNPKLIAEFPPGAAQDSSVSGPYPGAIALEQPSAYIRIWRLPDGIDAVSVLNDLDSKPNQAAIYSPVFHDTPSPASRMRTLPGNIVVYFNEGWNEETINQWIQAHKLRIVRRLAIGPAAAFVFQTGPGLEGLELANSLQGTDEVNAAFPDWWHETVSR